MHCQLHSQSLSKKARDFRDTLSNTLLNKQSTQASNNSIYCWAMYIGKRENEGILTFEIFWSFSVMRISGLNNLKTNWKFESTPKTKWRLCTAKKKRNNCKEKKKQMRVLPFVPSHQPALLGPKKILMNNWVVIQKQSLLKSIDIYKTTDYIIEEWQILLKIPCSLEQTFNWRIKCVAITVQERSPCRPVIIFYLILCWRIKNKISRIFFR